MKTRNTGILGTRISQTIVAVRIIIINNICCMFSGYYDSFWIYCAYRSVHGSGVILAPVSYDLAVLLHTKTGISKHIDFFLVFVNLIFQFFSIFWC